MDNDLKAKNITQELFDQEIEETTTRMEELQSSLEDPTRSQPEEKPMTMSRHCRLILKKQDIPLNNLALVLLPRKHVRAKTFLKTTSLTMTSLTMNDCDVLMKNRSGPRYPGGATRNWNTQIFVLSIARSATLARCEMRQDFML